jgi:hypothetical protein
MEQPENERLAVAQSPYSAVPSAPGMVERIAGATTDMQYIVHQGFTRSNATFWVGANALLRTTALHDIATTRIENGVEVKCFIADRTVIEDTESSVDLMARGWGLFNYPQRLSYSATLRISVRRWFNADVGQRRTDHSAEAHPVPDQTPGFRRIRKPSCGSIT